MHIPSQYGFRVMPAKNWADLQLDLEEFCLWFPLSCLRWLWTWGVPKINANLINKLVPLERQGNRLYLSVQLLHIFLLKNNYTFYLNYINQWSNYLPTLWTNSFGLAGKLKLITLSNCGMSIPRAATSVTTSTLTFPVLNLAALIFRAEGSKLE